MKNKQKGNKTMFYLGIVLVIASAILFLGNFMVSSTLPTILGVIGIVFIGASKFRLLK
jgi:uncharacterized membrane protein HdeD (DUF308 family)